MRKIVKTTDNETTAVWRWFGAGLALVWRWSGASGGFSRGSWMQLHMLSPSYFPLWVHSWSHRFYFINKRYDFSLEFASRRCFLKQQSGLPNCKT